jgi:hypothetical protein
LDHLAEVEEAGVVVALLDDMHESNGLLFPEMAIGKLKHCLHSRHRGKVKLHVTKMPKCFWKRYKREKCLQGCNRP